MLWRASAGRALRPLDSDGPPRTGLGRPLLRALGISRRLHRTPAAGRSNVRRVARRNCAHAARSLPHLHVPGIVALVPWTGLSWDEARPELARTGEVFPQVRRSDWSCA